MKELFAIIFTFSLAQVVIAEDCYYIDCEGMIGYVYIPDAVINPPKGYREGSDSYQIKGLENLLFDSEGLPDINSIQTISNNQTSFYWFKHVTGLASHLNKHQHYILDKERMIARANPFSHRSFLMEKGSRVKILGYMHFPQKELSERLLAQIQYIAGPTSNKQL